MGSISGVHPPLWRLVLVVAGGVITHTTFGATYSYGNFAPYIVSYMRYKKVEPDLQYNESVWIFAMVLLGQGTTGFIGGMLERLIGPRLTTLTGSWIMRYFSQPEVLDRVPICFLILGAMFAVMQLTGSLMIRNPPTFMNAEESRKRTVAKPEIEGGMENGSNQVEMEAAEGSTEAPITEKIDSPGEDEASDSKKNRPVGYHHVAHLSVYNVHTHGIRWETTFLYLGLFDFPHLLWIFLDISVLHDALFRGTVLCDKLRTTLHVSGHDSDYWITTLRNSPSVNRLDGFIFRCSSDIGMW
ncbi:Hypothetical predicted protein [Octopus vulgaris]|uniref:Uncharacterized protein n=1 Tax=Octopus vulgaris TaxID=6645 RepID=A0AA36ASZ1_OCTVU|nr:Hypothetical predicted protein [Octopus vulgaris]